MADKAQQDETDKNIEMWKVKRVSADRAAVVLALPRGPAPAHHCARSVRCYGGPGAVLEQHASL